MKAILQSLRMLLVMTVITGVLYPVVITLAAGVLFPYQANGSLITKDGVVIGSELIGQDFSGDRYFWGRPSAIGYNPMPSSGSNQGPTNAALQAAVQERAANIRAANGLADDAVIPIDLLFASASGLDPQISPEAATLQLDRVATARGFSAEQKAQVQALVAQFTENPQYGILGQPRVNVLLLNIALDNM